MKNWRMTPALVLGLLALPAAALAQEQMAAEEVSIDEIHASVEAMQAEFAAAVNGDDPASAARFYTADAVAMPPGAAAIEGAEAIGEYFGAGMGGATLELETWDVLAQGSDVVFETGGYEITGSDGGHLDHGKYMAVLVRTDDGWKMKYDMWNSSMAPSETDHDRIHEEMHGVEGHDEVHEAEEHGDMEKAADDAMDAVDMDDDGDAVPTMEEDEEM